MILDQLNRGGCALPANGKRLVIGTGTRSGTVLEGRLFSIRCSFN